LDSAESQSILQFVYAEVKVEDGFKAEAAALYEKGLETLKSPYALNYLSVLSRQDMGWLYEVYRRIFLYLKSE